jgi:hypothetical protein
MPWGRVLLGLLVSALVLSGLAMVVLQMRQPASSLQLGSPPGLSETDRAALAAPAEDLFAGRDEDIVSSLIDEVDRDAARSEVDRMQAELPRSPPRSSRLMFWRSTQSANGQWLAASHEYDFGDRVGRSETVLVRPNAEAPWRIETFNIRVVDRSSVPSGAVDITGKPASYVAIVAAAVFNPLFILLTFWAALLWKRVRPRWIWLIVTVLGFVTFSLNAAAGDIGINPLSVQLFGAAAMWSGSVFDPWMVSVSVPFGAIAFWIMHAFRAPEA